MEPAFSWRSGGLSGSRSVTHLRAEEPRHFPSVGHVGCPRGDISPFVTSFSFPYALRMIHFLMHCIKVCHVSCFKQTWHDCCLLCCDEPEHPTSFSFPYALRMMRVCDFLMLCIKVCHVSCFKQIWHDRCLLCCDEPEHPPQHLSSFRC